MNLKLIAKVEESLVFEVDKGLYIIARPSDSEYHIKGRCEVTPCWLNPLGRFAWNCSKCSSDAKEAERIELMEENKDKILEELREWEETYEKRPELRDENAMRSEEMLSSMKDGEIVSWE